MKENNNKEEEKKENIEEIQNKKPSYKIFFNNPELNGFYLAFFAMLFFPIITFFISRNVFKSFGYSQAKQDAYAMICSIIIIWIILVSFIVIYYLDDFKKVFGKNNNEKKDIKEKKE